MIRHVPRDAPVRWVDLAGELIGDVALLVHVRGDVSQGDLDVVAGSGPRAVPQGKRGTEEARLQAERRTRYGDKLRKPLRKAPGTEPEFVCLARWQVEE
ncbi:hypothetical protein SAMN04490356_0824 [Streptomyces melanosporofaciens]|uniref:Uncharacterized protein n=1 Tax=Streptomyces melanosporofaciens TaxID=67327 RepID=A0A1H4KLR8_STRMJ|nr:hypothetical protein [Streptomyces melanosporofaciens]SEB59427.1 hypothetical protein SAMN04490356_0824 [Streptomyces melanosporofaciens]